MDVKVLHCLLNYYNTDLRIVIIDDKLMISPNEYLTLSAFEANEILDINGS
ncbi:MAG: hypothetical protein ACYCWE_10695 [Eubacteriales bacterium]